MKIPEAISRGLDYTHSAEVVYTQFAEQSIEFRDLFTVPTAVSLSGLALVVHGAKHIETLQGVNEIAAGRSFDLLDGFLARALNQESDLGIMIDAIADKMAMAVIVRAAWKQQVIPKSVLGTVIASNVANAGLTLLAADANPEDRLRPTKAGKQSMALFNASLLSHAYASALEREHPEAGLHDHLRKLGQLTFYAGTAGAGVAAFDYAKRI